MKKLMAACLAVCFLFMTGCALETLLPVETEQVSQTVVPPAEETEMLPVVEEESESVFLDVDLHGANPPVEEFPVEEPPVEEGPRVTVHLKAAVKEKEAETPKPVTPPVPQKPVVQQPVTPQKPAEPAPVQPEEPVITGPIVGDPLGGDSSYEDDPLTGSNSRDEDDPLQGGVQEDSLGGDRDNNRNESSSNNNSSNNNSNYDDLPEDDNPNATDWA